MKRVCLDPGHGGTQPGAVYGDLEEKDVVLEVCRYVVEELQRLDAEIWYCLTRSWDQTLTLQQRCDMANNMKVDCFVSVHCNADPDLDLPGMPEAKGEEIWFYKGSRKGKRLAECLAKWVDQIFPEEPFRGIKETDLFFVLKNTEAPAVLIEIGFIDKSSSFETFSSQESLRKIGGFIAKGIYEYLNSDLMIEKSCSRVA